jgi:putative glycerol-1-phosphate prenyltransferase
MHYNKMKHIYNNIVKAIRENRKLLAVLIDPEKIEVQELPSFLNKVNESRATHIFIGGSTDVNSRTSRIVEAVKKETDLPILLFPGDYTHVTEKADGLLFLSLISGRNPEYLIEQQVQSIPLLQKTDLEIIPTGYLLIDGGVETSVQRVSNTKPMCQNDPDHIVNTALAGEYSGKKIVYLEAGSGATNPVDTNIIKAVKQQVSIPVIVGGGIRTKKQLENAYDAGADLVVIGTAFENDQAFFDTLKT